MKIHLLPKHTHYKANLHTHSKLSDGEMSVEEVKSRYQEKGYSIVAFTDHELFVKHNDLTDDKFLAINGFEIIVNQPKRFGKTYHLNFLAKDPDEKRFPAYSEEYFFFKNWPETKAKVDPETQYIKMPRIYDVAEVNKLVASGRENGFLVTYNHPAWSMQDYSDYIGLEGIWGVEFYNHGCTEMDGFDDNTMKPIEDFLHVGKRVFPLATDDAHNLQTVGGGWVWIAAESLDYATVMAALERGDFYASIGPEISELSLEDGILTVKCSPARRVIVTTERRHNRSVRAKEGESLTEATIDLRRYFEETEQTKNNPDFFSDPFFRVTVEDANGKTARTRAYFVDELQK